MVAFLKLDFPLNLNDPSYSSKHEALNDWFRQMGRKMESWDIIDDDDKIAVCQRNLTGILKEEAVDQCWTSYISFKIWARENLEPVYASNNTEAELNRTSQRSSFREYEERFRKVWESGRHSQDGHVSEQTAITIFLRNMRNKMLHRVLSGQVFTSFDSLVEFAQDLIRKGRVKERYPSEYPTPTKKAKASGSPTNAASARNRDPKSAPEPKPHLFSTTISGMSADSSDSSDIGLNIGHYQEREMDFDHTEYSRPEYAWMERMSPVLYNHPLDAELRKFASETEGITAWLTLLEQSLFALDFHTDQEEVAFCLYNSRGFTAEAASKYGRFGCFIEFKQWAQSLYGIKDQKRDIVRDMVRTTQRGSLCRYIFQFQKFLAANKYCKYPVSPELVSEIFVDNLKDTMLQSRLRRDNSKDLHSQIAVAREMLELGEIPNAYMAWETSTPPFNSRGQSLDSDAPGPGPGPGLGPGQAMGGSRNFDSKQPKRSRMSQAHQKQPRNVRVKTESFVQPTNFATGDVDLITGQRNPAFDSRSIVLREFNESEPRFGGAHSIWN